MQVTKNIIAKKYAVAFLNLFFDQITEVYINRLFRLKDFLKKNKLFYIYLRIPTISYLVKQKALNRLAQYFEFNKPLKRLMFLLLDQGRIDILDKVIEKIIIVYRQKKNIEMFKIFSSHEIAELEKKHVIKFIKHIAKGDIITKFMIDKKLIAGLRIQSNTFLWERSIAKQLRDVKRSIFKQVGIW
ncbi:hypothetical protein GF322_04270 [Candidatus Dependentiae bacterium]|nr:hypothetical protein [Candidatus Dependentiae bacterium]